MKEKIVKTFNIQDYLKTKEEIVEYLKASIEEDTPEEFINSMSNVLKSEGYSKIAEDMGVSREGLYKSFSGKVKPRFETICKAINSLGLKLSLSAI